MTGSGPTAATDRSGGQAEHAAAPTRQAADLAAPAPGHGGPEVISRLQRGAGNQATSALIQRLRLSRAPTTVLQRCGGISCPPGTCDHTSDPADTTVHRLADRAGSSSGTGLPASVLRVLNTAGSPLDSSTRESMEARLGHDFGHVRVHTDAEAARSARDIDASAYTFGGHVVLDAGRHRPDTPSGRRVLAHELAHVVQQGGSPGSAGGPTTVSHPHDQLEQEADEIARWSSVGLPGTESSVNALAARQPPSATARTASVQRRAHPGLIQRNAETWYRGEAEGVSPARPGSVVHDFGDGLYLTDDPGVAAQYATLRAGEQPAVGRVVVATFERSLLGRVLDLTRDPRWAAFLRERSPSGITFEQLIRMANENYWSFFQQFLQRHNLALEDFDTIIGPEFVRGGNQMCIRDAGVAARVRALFGAPGAAGATPGARVEYPVETRFRVISADEIPGRRTISHLEVTLGEGLEGLNSRVVASGGRPIPATFVLRVTTDEAGALVSAEASASEAAVLAETLARQALATVARPGAGTGAAAGAGAGARAVSPWVRGASWAGLALFAAVTIYRYETAAPKDRPRVLARAGGGFVAASAGGYVVCNLVLGIETLGWSLLICGGLVGVVAGVGGEAIADVVYDEATIDDDEIRAWVSSHRPDQIARLPATEKLRMIFSLMRGWISDEDVTAMEAILAAASSNEELTALRRAIEPHLLDFSSIGQRTRLRVALVRRR